MHSHQPLDVAQQIGYRALLLDCDLWQVRLYVAQDRVYEATQRLQLLLVHEFRPNASSVIFQELSAALVEKASEDRPSMSASSFMKS